MRVFKGEIDGEKYRGIVNAANLVDKKSHSSQSISRVSALQLVTFLTNKKQ